MRRAALIVAAAALGCAAGSHLPRALPPLSNEGAVSVYLQAFPEDAARLSLSVAAVSVARPDGGETPLEVAAADHSGAGQRRQRLLAAGRVPPGRYGAVVVRVRRATLAGEEGPVDLLVGEPIRVELPLDVPAGAARVVQLSLAQAPVDRGFELGRALRGEVRAPASATVQRSGYVTSTAAAAITVFDRHTRQVTAAIPTGREPQGLAIDPLAQRAYVALSGEDQVQVIDLATGHDLARIQLRSGDEPRELALTPDGKIAVAVDPRSSTVSFLDTVSGAVLQRLPVGQEPSALLLGPGGRRAYVLNRRSNDITVLDVGNRAVAGTLATEPEPVRAALNRAGTRLYVVHRGSAYMRVFSLPDLAPADRVYVGLGVAAVRVDGRTDRIYVASSGEGRVQVFDPFSLLPVDALALPGPATWLTIDDVENTLVAVMPDVRAVAWIDLTSRQLLSVADVGPEPYQAAFVGERP